MTNIFGDFRRLVLAALDDLVAQGMLPPGLDFGRVAVEPPRDPAHGDLATNAAMVLAGAVKQNPMALAEKIAAALLAKAGFAVHREYYINDAGAQVDALARSVYFRYQEAIDAEPESRLLHSSMVLQPPRVQPEGFYPGEYLKDTGRQLFERDWD